MNHFLIVLAVLFLTACQPDHLEIFPPLESESLLDKKFTVAQLHEDIDYLVKGAKERHPNLFGYANEAVLHGYVENVKKQITKPMTRLEFYRFVGQITHKFNDGHAILLWPYPEFSALEKTEHKPFPFDISVTKDGSVMLKHDYENVRGESLAAGTQITHISGREVTQLMTKLQTYAGGETALLRQQFVASRFPLFLWAVTGMVDEFELQLLVENEPVAFEVSAKHKWKKKESMLSKQGAQGESFYYKQLNAKTGFLYVGHFDIDPDEFETFVDRSFAQIKAQGIKNLIVDVRDNTGGNTDTVTYLSRHLADKPFRLVSKLTEKLNSDNRGLFNYKGEVGEMIETEWDDWEKPVKENVRFTGKTYLLISPVTYSAGIVFATTLKDNKFATLIGQETGGYANQTAQGNLFNLPHSQLRAYITTRLLVRPSGDTRVTGVIPHFVTEMTQQSLESSTDVEVEKALELISHAN